MNEEDIERAHILLRKVMSHCETSEAPLPHDDVIEVCHLLQSALGSLLAADEHIEYLVGKLHDNEIDFV